MWPPSNANLYLFPTTQSPDAPLFIAHSDQHFKGEWCIFSCGYSLHPEAESAANPILPVSVAGEGVLGPCGPRTGNSSGVRPGSSSGRGGSPGSCIGGGTSGRGLPGGLSCGGSDGCPGLIGGSSGWSIGISRFPESGSGDPEPTALLRQGSGVRGLKRAPASYCCGSCRSLHSRARACRRRSQLAIRSATGVRSPPRGATGFVAPP